MNKPKFKAGDVVQYNRSVILHRLLIHEIIGTQYVSSLIASDFIKNNNQTIKTKTPVESIDPLYDKVINYNKYWAQLNEE